MRTGLRPLIPDMDMRDVRTRLDFEVAWHALSRDIGRDPGQAGPSEPPANARPVLLALDGRGSRTIADLADQLHLQRSTVSRVSTRLAELGLVNVKRGDCDGRERHVRLASPGEDFLVRQYPQSLSARVADLEPGGFRTLALDIF